MNKILRRGIVAAIVLGTVGTSSFYNYTYAKGEHAVEEGDGAKADGNKSVAIGYSASAEQWNSIAIGDESKSRLRSVAIGRGAEANGGYSVALGDGSTILDSHSVAIGNLATTSKSCSVALGDEASSYGVNSVAIGFRSIAKDENEFSVGVAKYEVSWIRKDLYRRITHVADGVKDHDAVTVEQLKTKADKSELSSYLKSSDLSSYAKSTELAKKANVDLDNLTTAGTSKVKTLAGEQIIATVTQDFVTEKVKKGNVSSTTLDVTGTGKLVDSDLTIDLKDGSVTKEKLANDLKTEIEGKANTSDLNKYVKNTDLSSYAKSTELAKKANVDLDNLTTTGISKVKTLAGEQITATVTEDFVTGKVKKGSISSTTLDVTGNGKLVDSDLTIDLKDGSVTKGKLANDLKTEIEGKANATDLNAYAKTDATNITGESLTKWQSALGNGTIAENDKGLVTGGTVHTALQGKADKSELSDYAKSTELAKKANVDLDNLTTTGISKVKSLAGEQITATVTQDFVTEKVKKGNLTSDTLNVTGNGKLVDSDLIIDLKDGSVTKGKLANDLQTEIEGKANTSDLNKYVKNTDLSSYAKSTELAKKANVDLDNLTTAGTNKVKTLAGEQITATVTQDFVTEKVKKGSVSSTTLDVTGNGKLVDSDLIIDLKDGSVTKGKLSSDLQTEIEGKANTSDLNKYVKNTDLSSYAKTSDLNAYAKNTELAKKADTNASNLTEAEDILAWQKKLGLADNSATVTPGSTATTNLYTTVNNMNTTVNQLKAGYTVKAGTNTFDMKLGDTTAPTIEFAGDSTNGLDVAADKAGKKITYAINKDKLVKYIAGDLIKQMNGEGTPGSGDHGTPGSGNPSGHGTGEQGQTTPLPVLTNVSTGFNIAVGDNSKNFTFGKGKETNKLTFAETKDETVISLTGEDGTPTITVGLADTFKTKVNNKADKDELKKLETKVNNITGGTTNIEGSNIDLTTNNTFKELKTSVEGKANADGSNVTTPSTWATKLGTGEVATGNANLVTGGKVFNAIKDKADKSDLSSYAKTSDLSDYAKSTELAKKANVDLDNLTDAGTNKVKTLAGEQIAATVTENFVTEKVKKGNLTSDTLDVTGNGKLVDSDLKIDLKDGSVTKGKLANDLKTEIEGKANTSDLNNYVKNTDLSSYAKSTELAKKANVDLDNLTTAGTNKVKTLAGEQITATVTQDFVTEKVKKGALTSDTLDVTGTGKLVDSDLKIDLKDGSITKGKLSNDLKTEIEGKANASDLNKYVKNTDLSSYAKTSDLNAYAKNTELATKADKNAENIEVLAWQKKLGLADNSATVTPGSTTTTNLFTTVNQLKAGYTVKAGTNTFDMKLGDTAAPTIEFAGDSTNGLDVAADKAGKKITYAINKDKLVKSIAGDLIKQMNGEGTPGSGDHGTPGSGNPSGHGTGEQGQTTPLPVLTNVSTGFNIAVGNDSKNFTFGKGKETNKLTFAGTNDETSVSISGEDGTPTITVGLADTFKTKVNNKADKSELSSYAKNSALKELETKVNNITNGTTNIEGSNIDLSTNNTFKELKTSVEGKANADGSNVTTPATWATKLGTGKVAENNKELVTGGTVYTSLKGKADKNAENIEVLAWKKKLGLVDAQATQDSTTNISTQITGINNDITNLKGGFIVSAGTKSKEITLGGTTKDKLTFASADKNLTATFDDTKKTISYGVNVANLIGDINKSSTKITNVDLTNNQTITNLKTEIQNITNNGTTSMNGINFYLGGTSSGTTYTPSAKAEDKWQSSRIVFGEGLKAEKLKDAGNIEYTKISATGGGQGGKSAYEIWRDHKDDKGLTPNSNKSETEFLDSLKGQSGIKGADGKDGKSAYEVWRDYKEGNDSQPNKGKSEKDFMNYMKGKDCSADIQHIADNVTKGLSAMDGRMNSISAGAAALSALRPISNEYDPDDKLDFSVGFGHYRGENAVAIGAYYRPNPNMMVSLGGAFNGYDNLLNAGLSWKLGKGNEVAMLSKKVLLNEVIRLTKINKEMAAKIELQEEKIAHQESMISEQDARLKKIESLLAVK